MRYIWVCAPSTPQWSEADGMTLKIVSYRYTLPNAAVRDINMIVLGMAQNFRQLGLGHYGRWNIDTLYCQWLRYITILLNDSRCLRILVHKSLAVSNPRSLTKTFTAKEPLPSTFRQRSLQRLRDIIFCMVWGCGPQSTCIAYAERLLAAEV